MKADERRVSFNLKPNLNILLVDLYHTESRKVLPSVERLFQDDTILWEFIHDYLPIKNKSVKVDASSVYDILRSNEMGYAHIVADDRKWENFTKSDQNKLIANFKEQVRQLESLLLVVVGKKTYEELFKKSQPSISGVMPAGFRPYVIKWHRTAKDRKRGSTKIFLMRKTVFKSFEDRDICGKKLCSFFICLRDLKEKHSDRDGSNDSPSDDRGEILSALMECHLDSGLEQEIRASLESSEKDKLSDDSTNTDSSGIDAE